MTIRDLIKYALKLSKSRTTNYYIFKKNEYKLSLYFNTKNNYTTLNILELRSNDGWAYIGKQKTL